MISIIVNDEIVRSEANCTLQQFLVKNNLLKEWCACAVNQVIISRYRYAEVVLHHNDSIQIVTPMQGG